MSNGSGEPVPAPTIYTREEVLAFLREERDSADLGEYPEAVALLNAALVYVAAASPGGEPPTPERALPEGITTRFLKELFESKHGAREGVGSYFAAGMTQVEAIISWWEREVRPEWASGSGEPVPPEAPEPRGESTWPRQEYVQPSPPLRGTLGDAAKSSLPPEERSPA